jgi:hypothetical protein
MLISILGPDSKFDAPSKSDFGPDDRPPESTENPPLIQESCEYFSALLYPARLTYLPDKIRLIEAKKIKNALHFGVRTDAGAAYDDIQLTWLDFKDQGQDSRTQNGILLFGAEETPEAPW